MDPLTAFIEHARSNGMDHATIRMLLLSAGWKERDIVRGLTAQALDVPVPTPPDAGGAREAFLHLLSAAALYTSVSYALTLVFSFINLRWPDQATTPYAQLQSEAERGIVPVAMAAVFVALPLLVWLSSTLIREMRVSPDKARSPLRLPAHLPHVVPRCPDDGCRFDHPRGHPAARRDVHQVPAQGGGIVGETSGVGPSSPARLGSPERRCQVPGAQSRP